MRYSAGDTVRNVNKRFKGAFGRVFHSLARVGMYRTFEAFCTRGKVLMFERRAVRLDGGKSHKTSLMLKTLL